MSYQKFESSQEADRVKRGRLVNRYIIIFGLFITLAVASIVLSVGNLFWGSHEVFTLIRRSDRMIIMGLSFLAWEALIFAYYSMKAMRDTTKSNKWIKGVIMGSVVSAVLSIVTLWFIERGNNWFANKEATYTERVVITTLRKTEISESKGRTRTKYVVGVTSLKDGYECITSKTSKPDYFNLLHEGEVYDATVYDGFFGFKIIKEFSSAKPTMNE